MSFADSLNKIKSSISSTVVAEPKIMTLSTEEPAIMTLEEPISNEAYNGLAYSGLTRSSKYEWYDNYHDEEYSEITKTKDIVMNKNQINLTQEENSQFIPFKIPRYWDGIDLMDMSIKMRYVNSAKEEDITVPKNVQYDTEYIYFGILADLNLTYMAGEVQFEIFATGVNEKGENYLWRTRPNGKLNIEKSLVGNGVVQPSEEWLTQFIRQIDEKIAEAQVASQQAEYYAQEAANSVASVDEKIASSATTIKTEVLSQIESTLLKYYTKDEVNALIEGIQNQIDTLDGLAALDIQYTESTRTLTFYNGESIIKSIVLNSNPTAEWVGNYDAKVDLKISEALSPINTDLQGIHDNIDDLPNTLQSDYYNKTQIDEKLDNVTVDLTGYATETYVTNITDVLSTDIDTNTGNIQTINTAITTINQTLDSLDKSPNAYYITTYNEPYVFEGTEYTGENTLVVYEIYNKDKENETRTVVASHVIQGGSGSGTSNIIKIERITGSPFVVTTNDEIIIEYNFIGTDSSGEDISQGNATWKLGNQVIKTEKIYTGKNFVDLTEFIGTGSDQKITLIITDDIGTISQKSWYVSVVDVKLESTFNDKRYYTANSPIDFTYTPYGAVDKTIHFLLDGKEIGTVVSTKAAAGLSTSYSIPAQSHGTHLFEIYMTANINNNDVESNHIVKDIIWYDETSTIPVIGCVQQNFVARQYETTNITYTVYDSSTETPKVNLKATYVNEDGETVETYNSSLTLTTNTDVWQFKTDIIGEHTLTITCGETVKTLKATITELGIDVNPTTAGLEFDFNPVGYSNNDANRIWSDKNTGVNMTVSNNFDWVNGGYQIDENGDQYFCIKAGTTATINYNLFNDDAKENGKEFKVIFKTTNIKKRNTSFISCMDYGIGLDMKVESANIYSSNGSLYSPYCEEDIIEFEFNINKNTDIPLVLTYEDGVGNRPMIYTSDSSFWQTNPTPITIGSAFCDVHIYRMKAYSTSLTDKDILNNFIADARSAEEMIARYERNQIYKDGILNPEYLAEKCPDLRIILVDAPWFTNDKDNKVEDTNITMIYKNGDPILDNWTCTGAKHSGQGTSSNEYGYAGRNIDLIMDTDTSLFILGDGKTTSKTITLTRSSVPTDYLNVKVNIASSENENNAQMARRYNQFNPFVRSAKFNDSKVKDTMEFYNCIIFVRERNEDISTHREFLDTNYHYYALGNIGDSKKTDDTRVNNKKDPKECIVEITDYNVSLAEFPTGYGANNKEICPISEWKAGNTAYDFLYAAYKYKDGKFKSFGSESYEFRYEMKGITEEQRQVNIDNWREMYKFIVTSSDEEFYSRLKEYFVVDSALYFYLFTERYTMVDNRAKNSFWHYGKVYITQAEATILGNAAGGFIIDDEQASIHEGYRWDLSQGYDFDTSLGIDNTGKLVLTYGKEDTDYYVDGDASSSYIYRAAESRFFCRLRDLFKSEMQAMFVNRENVNAWSASGLIKQWDDAQSQFPEEIWRLDIERKYLRTYLGKSVDNSKAGEANPRFLTEMMNGRKKYQRRMFERNQELYMATKYFGKVATQDQIMMRFNNPVGATIKPDFTLYLTPYSDMYIGVSFGNVTPVNFRAKAGVEYTVPCSIESGTADITLIYGASFIQAIGDLSKCYVGDNDFSKASRLQSLVIGSDVNGYENSFMTKISLGNNKLLEYLDIRKITGLNSVVDLSECGNLIELHAENCGATGIIFANGGKVEKAYIPAVTSLTVKNLNYLKEFIIAGYDKLQTLIVENTPFINTHEMVTLSPILNILRLIGLNWNIETTDILDRVLSMRGISNTGGEITQSVLTGNVFVPVVRQQELREFNEAWQDLDIKYNTLIEQFPVIFKNEDGTILDIQYVDKGGNAVDPITSGRITTPTKESTISHNFTFDKWDSGFTNIFAERIIVATYTSSLREYTVKYVSKGTTLQETKGLYGDNILYKGDTPVYTLEESAYAYHLFNRWDKSGFIDGDKTINAVFDRFEYSEGCFNKKELSDLSPVEIYALTKLGLEQTVITDKDSYSFSLGHDYDFDDIESSLIINEKTVFNGTNQLDTGIQLFDVDKDFVLAIDYKFLSGTKADSVLAQCYQSNGSNGFQLRYNNGVKFKWGSTAQDVTSIGNREMVIIRHKKGDKNITIYNSNLSGASVSTMEIDGSKTFTSASTLVFGCVKADDGFFENHAVGEINWAKLWLADLGDEACTTLALWTHEKLVMEACGFRKYYLSDNASKRCSFSLLASHLLDKKYIFNISNNNTGGWATSTLNQFLNTRLYDALPLQMKQLIKQVKVGSSIGNMSNEISYSDCYITVPAVKEVDPSMTSEPYNSESTVISYMNSNTARKRAYVGGDYSDYWTRSPNTYNSSYIYQVSEAGDINGFKLPSSQSGILVQISI